MNRMTVMVSAAFVVMLSCEALPAQEAPPGLTFTECHKKVAAYYPVLKRQSARVDVAVAERLHAVAEFFPALRGVSSVTASDDPVTVFSELLKQSSFTESNFAVSSLNYPRHRTNFRFALEGEWSIFNAFQTVSRIRRAECMVYSAEQEAAFLKAEASLIATEAYLQVLVSERVCADVERVVRSSAGDIEQAKELKDRGVVLGADYFAARVSLGMMTQLRNDLSARRDVARAVLNILMGEDPLKRYELSGDIGGPVRDLPALQGWIMTASRSRADLAAMRAQIRAQEEELFRERTSFLPRVSAFGILEENTENWRTGGNSYTAGFRGGMDLFDPSLSPRVRKAKEMLRVLQHDEGILRDRITRALTEEHGRYESVRQNLPVTAGIVSDATEAVDLMIPLYQEGRKSIADLIEMRSAYLHGSVAERQLRAESETSYARMLFLSGMLNDKNVEDIARRIEGGGPEAGAPGTETK